MRKPLCCALIGSGVLATLLAQTPQVAYPEGYREWRHVKSMVIARGHPLFDAFGGIHHIYANPPAVKGYATACVDADSIPRLVRCCRFQRAVPARCAGCH